MKRYSKMIAALVSAAVALLATHYAEIDAPLLEGAILMVLTALGVYASPANSPGANVDPWTQRTPVFVVVLAVMLVGLAGCSSAPYRAPTTVYEGLLIADTYGEQVTRAVNDLRRAGVITRDQHQEALDHLQDALNTSRAARAAYQASNWQAAETGLDRTESALRLLSVLLVPYLPEDPANEAFLARYGAR